MVAIAIRPCEGVDAAALYTKIKAEIKSQVSLCTYRMIILFIVAMWLACTCLSGFSSNDVLPATQNAGLVSRAISIG